MYKGKLHEIHNLRKEWEEKLNSQYRRRVSSYTHPTSPTRDQNGEAEGQKGIALDWLHSRANRNRALLETNREVEQERERRQSTLLAGETRDRVRMEEALKTRIRRHAGAQERLKQNAEESWAREKELQKERQITRKEEHQLCTEREQLRSARREAEVDRELFAGLSVENHSLHAENHHLAVAAQQRVEELRGLDQVVARKRGLAHGAAAVDLRVFESDMGIQAENDTLERENAEMRNALERVRLNGMSLAFK